MRLLVLVLLAVLLALQIRLWVGEGGWREVEQLDASVAAQKRENAKLEQRNAALSAEVADLKQGQAAVEERARAELGMIKPEETFFRVVEPAAVDAAPEPDADTDPDADPGEGR
jgi:cell division protein FtsB